MATKSIDVALFLAPEADPDLAVDVVEKVLEDNKVGSIIIPVTEGISEVVIGDIDLEEPEGTAISSILDTLIDRKVKTTILFQNQSLRDAWVDKLSFSVKGRGGKETTQALEAINTIELENKGRGRGLVWGKVVGEFNESGGVLIVWDEAEEEAISAAEDAKKNVDVFTDGGEPFFEADAAPDPEDADDDEPAKPARGSRTASKTTKAPPKPDVTEDVTIDAAAIAEEVVAALTPLLEELKEYLSTAAVSSNGKDDGDDDEPVAEKAPRRQRTAAAPAAGGRRRRG